MEREIPDGFDRRSILKGIANGTAAVSGLAGSTTARADPGRQSPLTSQERSKLKQPYQDISSAKTVLAERTSKLREQLVETGFLDSIEKEELQAEETVLNGRAKSNDFTALDVSAVWNRELDRGEVLLQTRIDMGSYIVKLTTNPVGEVSSALIYDEEEIVKQIQTTGGEVTTSGTCNWDTCAQIDGERCCYGCDSIFEPDKYELYYLCTEMDGTVVTDTCLCDSVPDLHCCYECGDWEKIEECRCCGYNIS